jgi:cell division septation protein DedD
MSAARLLRVLLPLLVSALFFASCSRYRSSSSPVRIEQKDKNERVFDTNEQAVKAGVYEEFVDSAALSRGENPRPYTPPPVADDEPPPVPAVAPPVETAADESPGQVPPDVMLGFRIQLGAFADIEGAQQLADKARTVFGARYPVYVRFYSPYWKVQAGDCASRPEAQSLLIILRKNGYPDSFIVSSGVKR